MRELKQYLNEEYKNGDKNTWLLGKCLYFIFACFVFMLNFICRSWSIFGSTMDGSPESNFNKINSKARSPVERTIGILKNRFNCLLAPRELHCTPEIAGKVIPICAALHNMCNHYNIEWSDDSIEDCIESKIVNPNALNRSVRIMQEHNQRTYGIIE